MNIGTAITHYIMNLIKRSEENDNIVQPVPNTRENFSQQPSCSYQVNKEDEEETTNKDKAALQEEVEMEDCDDSYADPPFEPGSSSSSLTEDDAIEQDKFHRPNPENHVNNIAVASGSHVNKKRSRCKRGAPNTWIKTVRKTKRNSGLPYLTTAKKMKQERKSRNIGIECKCNRKCHVGIPDEAKTQLCTTFWQLGDLTRQRDYLAANVSQQKCTRGRKENSKRQFSLRYSLNYNGTKNQVCKIFFLDTLDISEKMLRTAMEKCDRNVAGIPSPDRRGKHDPGVKHANETIMIAENHIDSFPRVPAHWCRKDTKKEYLESILNKEKMYILYKEKCSELNQKCISATSYRELLIRKNIGFHIPKKDQCWCHHFEQLKENEKTAEKLHDYEIHIRRKIAAMEEKKHDSLKAKHDEHYVSANFDLEAVLYSPLLFAKPIFYKRKLATFNFTVYETAKQQGHCFFWPEYEGNRGANEIATCLAKFIQTLPQNTEHLVLHSDCCPGQNRNSIVTCMLLEAVKQTKNIKIIDLKFLEPGHTHMECDSMHASIERVTEHTKIFWPNDWLNVLRLANKKKSYKVNIMTHSDFLDYKGLKDKILINTKKTEEGENVNWKEIKWLRFQKDTPTCFQFRDEYWNDFKTVNVTRLGRKSKNSTTNQNLKPLYNTVLPISKKKFQNLQEMCHSKDAVIPKEYHAFYKSLNFEKPLGSNNNSDDDYDDEMSLQAMKEKMLRRKSQRNF